MARINFWELNLVQSPYVKRNDFCVSYPQKYNPLNILNLSRFQNTVEYSNINIDNVH